MQSLLYALLSSAFLRAQTAACVHPHVQPWPHNCIPLHAHAECLVDLNVRPSFGTDGGTKEFTLTCVHVCLCVCTADDFSPLNAIWDVMPDREGVVNYMKADTVLDLTSFLPPKHSR